MSVAYRLLGSLVCVAFGVFALVMRVPLRRNGGREFGPLEEALSWVTIAIGVVYALFTLFQYWQEREENPRKWDGRYRKRSGTKPARRSRRDWPDP